MKGARERRKVPMSIDSAEGTLETTTDRLVEQGQLALQNFQPDLALKFFQRALVAAPGDTNIMDALADVHLQLGQVSQAKSLLEESTVRAPTINCFKWLFLAQLQEGFDAVRSYQRAIELLSELILQSPQTGKDFNSESLLKKQITRAHVAIAELYLTDLCFENAAEQLCSASLTKALEFDSDSLDALQCLSSLRISQGNVSEACSIMEVVSGRVMASREAANSRTLLDEVTNATSHHINSEKLSSSGEFALEIEFCVQTAKILVECASLSPGLANVAVALCANLLEEDDDNIEVWYIAGVAALCCRPEDRDLARHYFSNAKEMIEFQRESRMGGRGLDDQYNLVIQHLEILDNEGHASASSADGATKQDCEMDEEWTDTT